MLGIIGHMNISSVWGAHHGRFAIIWVNSAVLRRASSLMPFVSPPQQLAARPLPSGASLGWARCCRAGLIGAGAADRARHDRGRADRKPTPRLRPELLPSFRFRLRR